MIRSITRLPRLLLAAATAAAVGCSAGAPEGDLPFDQDGLASLGKADALGLPLTEVGAPIDHDRLVKGGKAIITSAESWKSYFGTDAPADVDFSREWVAFYGAGMRSTGGFSAEIRGLSFLPDHGGLVLETHHQSPGFDCIVTMALTWPHAVVKFDIPEPRPFWAVSDHSEHTYRCSPTNEERLDDLAASRDAWEAAKAASGDSYGYTREFFSFLGFSFRTDFVVDSGVVVERHYKAQHHNAGGDAVTWSEIGAEVGTHTEGHRVALIDDLYDECESEVLTQDEEQNFINLSFDQAGLLQACTYFPIHCADDCSRGPVITEIRF
jgi:hypothetical protein